MTVNELWHINKEDSKIKTAPVSFEEEQAILIKSRYSLISTGTERLVANGQVPSALHEAMRVQGMKGSFNFPIKYGYSVVGEVVSKGILEGELVHLMYPHQDLIAISSKLVSKIPTTIPPKTATLASNMETALNAVWDSGVSVGDRVLVVGFGMIGGLVARLLSFLPVVEVFIIELNKARSNKAQKMGFKVVQDIPIDLDYAFHTSGTSEGLQTCIAALGYEGRVIELSWFGKKSVNLHLGGDFHYQRKQIISSQVGQIPQNKSARWSYQRRKEVVWELLKYSVFAEHLTHEIPFLESPSFFKQLRNNQLSQDGLGWVLKYE